MFQLLFNISGSIKLLYFVIFFLNYCNYSNAQESGEVINTKKIERKVLRTIKDGDYLFNQKIYTKALGYYLEIYKYRINDKNLNIKIGVCYLNTDLKMKCLKYFKKAYMLDSTFDEQIYYYLARGCHLNYQFDDAMYYYQKHISRISSKEEKIQNTDITKKIQECHFGKALISYPVDVIIENLGNNVNSEFPDYRPFISSDGNIMFFTSKREQSHGTKLNPFDNLFYEDIYSSNNSNGNWSTSIIMGDPINTPLNDAISGLSHDGKTMIIYNDNTTAGDLYITEYKSGNWTIPDRLPVTINSKYIESTSALSVTKDTLFFISDRVENSVGKKDIFFTYKDDKGKWAEAINLGNIVNTKYNEEGISVHPNGKMLFFSSEGHNSMGGYDIFVTTLQENGEWDEPINLGYPINTPDDDLFFVISGNNNIAYYSTVKEDSYGDEDVYKIIFRPEKLYTRKIIRSDQIKEIKGPGTEQAISDTSGKTGNNYTSSIEEIYKKQDVREILEKSFERKYQDVLNERHKKVLDQAKLITSQLMKEKKVINIETIKKNPQKVIVEVVNLSSSKGLDFTYPSGSEGTFVIMLPKEEYHVDLYIKDISTTVGKMELVGSEVQEELISNNIISIDKE